VRVALGKISKYMAMPKVKNTMYLVGAMGLMASLHSPAEAEPTITTSQAVSHTTIAANFLAARQALYLTILAPRQIFIWQHYSLIMG